MEAEVASLGGVEAGHRAIHLAAACGHTKCVRALVAAGASREALTPAGSTAAHCAAASGHVDALLAAGGNLNTLNKKRCHCLYMLARHAALHPGSVSPAQLRAVIETGAAVEAACAAGAYTPLDELLKRSAPSAYIAELAQ